MATDLAGQTVVVIGGSAGIGRATAALARSQGADVIITGRNPERLEAAGAEIGATRTAAFDATDLDELERFWNDLPETIDHVFLTAGGPYYAPLAELDLDKARRTFDEHVLVPVRIAQLAPERVRAGGTLIFIGGTGSRVAGVGLSVTSAVSRGLSPMVASLALEIAPVRVNLIAAGFVDTPLSASLLGEGLDERRAELRSTLPIARVVQPEDVAALAVHLMTNTALTGATYDIDGGEQFV